MMDLIMITLPDANSVWANDNAHNLKYDAVFETIPTWIFINNNCYYYYYNDDDDSMKIRMTIPKTNSIVSIVWWINISPN